MFWCGFEKKAISQKTFEAARRNRFIKSFVKHYKELSSPPAKAKRLKHWWGHLAVESPAYKARQTALGELKGRKIVSEKHKKWVVESNKSLRKHNVPITGYEKPSWFP